MEQATKALNVTTITRVGGEITSLVFNPNDGWFYGCNITHKTIATIKGSQIAEQKFEASLKALDLFVRDNYFIIVSDEPAAVYKFDVNGKATKIAWHVKGRDKLHHPSGVAINQNTGDAFITCQNGSVHKLTLGGELMVMKPRTRGITYWQKGLRGIVYDHDTNNLLVCDASNNKIISVDQITGKHLNFCSDIPDPYQIKKSGPKEYLVTSSSNYNVYLVKEDINGGRYHAKIFAGASKRGTLDGISTIARFSSPKGLAIDSRGCIVGDTNCLRFISFQVSLTTSEETPFETAVPPSPTIRRSASDPQPPSRLSLSPTIKKRHHSRPPKTTTDMDRSTIKKRDLINLERVGEGSQGVLFRAQWLGQQVIYKQMKQLTSKEGEEKNAFVKEFEAWKHATHQSCVSLYGIVDEGAEYGFVAEYCLNGSLDEQFSKKNMVLSAVQSIEYAVSLANAINVLHAKKIAHRDIKSSNVMLDQNMKPKLGDFGTSKFLDTMSGSSTQVGSFNYMAPEIIDGKCEDPFACDIYSFGVLLYEIATSTVVTSRRLAPTREKPEGFSNETREMWWDLVEACTQTNPTDRPSIGSVVTTLCAISKMVLGFRCKKHGKPTHKVFISYRVASDKDCAKALFEALENLSHQHGIDMYHNPFLDSECLPDGEDWEKCFLYGLQNCKSIVPIISVQAWENKAPDNVLKEYEHVFKMKKNKQKVKVFPWIVGPTPDVKTFPKSPHICSKAHIRSTLKKVLKYPSICKEKTDVEAVAEILMEKIKKMKPDPVGGKKMPLLDIGIVLEDRTQADYTVEIYNEDILLSELRKQMVDECEINFEFKFILPGANSPLSLKQEKVRKLEAILDKAKNRITIRGKPAAI